MSARSARLRVLLIIVVVFSVLAVFLWVLEKRRRDSLNTPRNDAERSASSVLNAASPPSSPPAVASPPLSQPSPTNSPPPEASQSPSSKVELPPSYVGIIKLIIPVAGVRPEQLIDTFTDARSEGRVHDAIDIPAPAGTSVLAAADGQIIKLFQSDRGGTTIYQASVDRKLIFYYAHLQGYADGIAEGKQVKQGEVIAYVGDTGNAGPGNYHLHFSISVVADAKRYWEGTNINPYPLLRPH